MSPRTLATMILMVWAGSSGVLAGAAVASGGTPPATPAAPTFTTVARSGQQVPGMPAGIVWTDFNWAPGSVDAAGRVAFIGNLRGPGVTAWNDTAIFLGGPGSVVPVMREGDSAPGIDGATLSSISGMAMNRAGQLAVMWGQGIYRVTNGVPELAAAQGQPLSGMPAETLAGIRAFVWIDDAGHLAFRSGSEANPSMMWLVAGTPGNMRFLEYGGERVRNMTSADAGSGGGITFLASDPTLPYQTNAGFWSADGATLTEVVTPGSPAPGFPAGATIAGLVTHAPSVDARGDVAFVATVVHGTTYESALYYGPTSHPEPLLRVGDRAPGFSPETTVLGFEYPTLGGAGGMVARVWVQAPGDPVGPPGHEGHPVVYGGPAGDLRVVAEIGRQAPGAPAGCLFSSIEGPGEGGQGQMAVNGIGQVAFVGLATNPVAPNDWLKGLWATDPGGTLHLVAYQGEPLAIDGYTGTVAQVALLGNTVFSGYGSGFNDAGQLSVFLAFEDGTQGIYLVSVPEPDATTLSWALASAGLAMTGRRRRHRTKSRGGSHL